MKTRYRLIHRGRGHGTFYCVDSKTGKRTSLGKATEEEARQIVDAKNQAERNQCSISSSPRPTLRARTPKCPSEPGSMPWRSSPSQSEAPIRNAGSEAAKDRALSLLWPKVIVETEAELVLKVLRIGTVSTNVYLRRLYNFCVDMNWLPWPIVPKRQWPMSGFRRRGPSPGRSTVGSSIGKRIPSEKHFISWPGTWEPPSRISLTLKPRTSTGRIA